MDEYEDLVDRNVVFRMRMEDLAPLSAADAINLGVTGPSLRGSGVDFDVRQDDPYEVYENLDWHSCV